MKERKKDGWKEGRKQKPAVEVARRMEINIYEVEKLEGETLEARLQKVGRIREHCV